MCRAYCSFPRRLACKCSPCLPSHIVAVECVAIAMARRRCAFVDLSFRRIRQKKTRTKHTKNYQRFSVGNVCVCLWHTAISAFCKCFRVQALIHSRVYPRRVSAEKKPVALSHVSASKNVLQAASPINVLAGYTAMHLEPRRRTKTREKKQYTRKRTQHSEPFRAHYIHIYIIENIFRGNRENKHCIHTMAIEFGVPLMPQTCFCFLVL